MTKMIPGHIQGQQGALAAPEPEVMTVRVTRKERGPLVMPEPEEAPLNSGPSTYSPLDELPVLKAANRALAAENERLKGDLSIIEHGGPSWAERDVLRARCERLEAALEAWEAFDADWLVSHEEVTNCPPCENARAQARRLTADALRGK